MPTRANNSGKAEVNSTADVFGGTLPWCCITSIQLNPLVQPTLAGATRSISEASNTACPRAVYTNTPDGRLIAGQCR